MDNILFYIQQITPSLTPLERKVSTYITQNPEKIPSMKISELGHLSGTNSPDRKSVV